MARIPDTTAAWLAALIDGEGSVMLIDRRKQRARQFRAVVSVANTDPRLAKALAIKTGIDRVYIHKAPGPRNRQQYTWRMNAQEIRKWLPILIPWLILKKKQAQLLLRYLVIAEANTCRAGKKRVITGLHHKEAIHKQIRLLNRRVA